MLAFAATSPKRRIITASVLLLLVSTVIPYQFAYLVSCIVQIATCSRASGHLRENVSGLEDDTIVTQPVADLYYAGIASEP